VATPPPNDVDPIFSQIKNNVNKEGGECEGFTSADESVSEVIAPFITAVVKSSSEQIVKSSGQTSCSLP
jgi:hypothetical protein